MASPTHAKDIAQANSNAIENANSPVEKQIN